ncbi:MAG: glycosyltransferase [Cyanobacteria bacterium J069]|nr:MAG: glycosyltransferase [Cyanobacteria bacterium J069]
MSNMTIGMISSYGDLKPPPWDWLWRQSPQPFGQWRNVQIAANCTHPDWLLMYNFHEFPSDRSARWPWRQRRSPAGYDAQVQALRQQVRSLPPERIFFLLREPPFAEKQQARIDTYQQAQQWCGFVSGPDDFAPQPEPMPAIWYVSQPFEYLQAAPPPEKLRPCSWITSGIDRTANHRQRLEFLRQLQASNVTFDLYGRGLPDWAQVNTAQVTTYGPVANKWHAIAPYTYNLAIENYADNDWYVSEKLWDALLSWSLPIYYGGSAADRLLPAGSFLRLPSLDEHGIAYIRAVTATPDAWYAAQGAIAAARQIILHELNLLNWLAVKVRG